MEHQNVTKAGGSMLCRSSLNRVLCGAAFLALVLAGVSEAGPLLGSSFDGTIYDIDPLTGLASNPRDTGLRTIGGIEFTNETLYAVSEFSLYTIDLPTGQPELIGELHGGATSLTPADVAWDPSTGTLFELAHRGGTTEVSLFAVDTTTPEVNQVGILGGFYSAIAFNDAGQLFALDLFNDLLVTVNKTNAGTINTIPLSTALDTAAAMTFDDDGSILVATTLRDGPSVLDALDPATGILTRIGSTGVAGGLSGLTIVPEPGALLLVLAGTVGVYRKRRRV